MGNNFILILIKTSTCVLTLGHVLINISMKLLPINRYCQWYTILYCVFKTLLFHMRFLVKTHSYGCHRLETINKRGLFVRIFSAWILRKYWCYEGSRGAWITFKKCMIHFTISVIFFLFLMISAISTWFQWFFYLSMILH